MSGWEREDPSAADIIRKLEAKEASEHDEEELTRQLGRIGLTWEWGIQETAIKGEYREVIAIQLPDESETES